MGLKDTASLALIPAAYKTSKIYSALPTDGDGDFTFTRTGNATRINKAGLVETMGTNIGRLNYDLTNGTPASCPSLLLEPSRQNVARQSEQFSVSPWNRQSSSVTTDQTTAPNGTQTADKIQVTGTNQARCEQFKSATSNTSTFSVFVKAGNNRYIALAQFGATGGPNVIFDLQNGAITTASTYATNKGIQAYPNGWYRIFMTYSHSSSDSYDIFKIVLCNNPTNYTACTVGENCFIWGAQKEFGNTLTSYIPTTTADKTRTADACGDAGNSTIIKAEGSLFVDFTTLNTDNFKRIYIISNADFNNSIFIQLLGTSFAVQVISGGTTLYSWGFTITLSDRHKIALRYKDGDSQLYYNGTQQTATTASGTWFSEGLLNKFTFSPSSFFNFYGEVNQAMVFNEALTDSELQTLTS